jgi:3-hydroxyacyl-[acyl-carrier-protein] dehydratase
MTDIDTASAPGVPGGLATVQLPWFDRTLEFEPGVRAVALRNIPGTLSFFATHFPRLPVLPGVVLLESMAALAGATAGVPYPTLRSVKGVRFRRFILPGDQVAIMVELTAGTAASGDWRAEARVDGRLVATVRALTLANCAQDSSAYNSAHNSSGPQGGAL